MFGKTLIHDHVTKRQADALEELAVLELAFSGTLAAQIMAKQNGVSASYLDRHMDVLKARRKILKGRVEDAGTMYATIDGQVRPMFVSVAPQ